MSHGPYLRLALPTPLRRAFDYLPPQGIDFKSLISGVRVKVPFQSRTLVGILTGISNETSIPQGKLKMAQALLDDAPIFPPDIYAMCEWAAAYYHYSFGEILSYALPALLRKGKAAILSDKASMIHRSECDDIPELNNAQQQAVDAVLASQHSFRPFLLDGVTGSGKTEVYLRVIAKILQAGKQVLVLVPEISLTPQTVARFSARFQVPIAALHSNLSDKARLKAWLAAREGDVRIVIGTRSAVFTPFQKLGIIIIDEEHDGSFKQQDRFRYQARDMAIVRARLNQIPIVLGSATPSLETLQNVRRKRYTYLSLPHRAGGATLPKYELIDLRRASHEEGLSESLLIAMQTHLNQGQQVMLFLNKRGYAPVLYCSACQFIVSCQRCDARMVFHRSPPYLKCHHCDAQKKIPTTCPNCHATTLAPVGFGTQRIEETLKKHFSNVPIIRIDRDSTRRKGALEDLFTQIHAEKKAILLGTQMLAKGHHFPHVTLVGVIDADSGLFSIDFRAAEQMGQLLMQVAGRAGRVDKQGTVMIQTRNPEHPLLQTLIHEGYPAFAHLLLTERRQMLMPPFTYFALLRAEAYKEKNANQFLQTIKELDISSGHNITILGPTPALLAKRKGLYCQHLLIKANKRPELQIFLKKLLQKIETLAISLPVKWVLDVDPIEVV